MSGDDFKIRTEQPGEHMTSWLESGPPRYGNEHCGFCLDSPCEDVRLVRWSRNGHQSTSFEICAKCRKVLAAHLA